MTRSRSQRVTLTILKGIVYTAAFLCLLLVLVVGLMLTPWGKNQLRRGLLYQARPYLSANLEIERLEGSLFTSFVLHGVRLSTEGRDLVGIERVELEYRIGELFRNGTTIRRLVVHRPRISAGRLPDGRWDIAGLLNRRTPSQPRLGPRRQLHLPRIDIADGDVELRTPVSFGAAHIPTHFVALNGQIRFDDDGTAWRVELARLSWIGKAPDLTMDNLTGAFTNRAGDFVFEALSVQSPRTAFVVDGSVDRTPGPAVFDLDVKAARFTFQEWSGILNGLRSIAIESAFDARLKGPLSKLSVDLNMRSNGGNVRGPFVLDTTVPGWHGTGTIDLERLNLARWLNREDRPSDISGRVKFDFALNLGHAPTGPYEFTGSHAAYFGYEADDLRATGTIAPTEARIEAGTARAYGADVRLAKSTIGFEAPYHYRFAGRITEIDLRDVPPNVPIPHVESTLTFDYDVAGQFSSPFIKGGAVFAPSTFLGAAIGDGGSGTIDTSGSTIRYGGEADLRVVDLRSFGEAFDVDWLRDPRYAGTMNGHFKVDVEGTSAARMTLQTAGRLAHGQFFGGTFTDGDVTLRIADASLDASYDGRFDKIDPAVALNDPRLASSLSGSGRAAFHVQDLFTRTPTLADYTIDSNFALDGTVARGVVVDRGRFEGRLTGGTLTVAAFELTGSALEAKGSGRIELEADDASEFDYTVVRASLSELRELLGRPLAGEVSTSGRLTGPLNDWRFAGTTTIDDLALGDVTAESLTASYDVTMAPGPPLDSTARIEGRVVSLNVLGEKLQDVNGTVSLSGRSLDLDLTLVRDESFGGHITGTALLNSDGHSLELSSLTAEVQGSSWRLRSTARPPTVLWDDRRIELDPLQFERVGSAEQLVSLSGAWRTDGSGVLKATVSRVFLDSFSSEQPARYGGVIDGEVALGGTLDFPTVSAAFTISDGRVRELPYEKLATRIDYQGGALTIDARLDQAPGIWLTVTGRAPLDLFSERSEQPMDLAVKSSPIALTLLEGVTDVVRQVTGSMTLDFNVIGTSRDPHFVGQIQIENASFVVASSGSRYKNGRAGLRLGSDRVAVEVFHLEDNRGHPLELTGSLGTHELRVGDLEINVNAKGFEVLRNEFGTIEIDALVELRGVAESPRVEGRLTVTSGELKVDEILDRALFRPYSMQAAATPALDAIAVLNPWDRLGLDLELRIPGTLRMTGDEVQIRSGTPLGLGSFNLRAIGELYLYKDPNDVMYVTGSLDSVSGTYVFQGRRFDIDPVSSINFQGDRNPNLYVTVGREISGVLTRVTILGSLQQPELQLTSTPPLDPSDVLSLIVFGTSTNSLSGIQQQQLAIRAGALAAGFLTTPLVGALERSLGLDILEIEAPSDSRSGPRVTIGDEIAPGLVARFSRQFGIDEYDEATIEYFLSRILRLRGTFSDAAALNSRSPFRRTERAGVDLILFFSF
jgi:TamB, inner membrane protein subunit of TAM complex